MKNNRDKNKGFTLLFALLITSIILGISIGFSLFIIRELKISRIGQESQKAFFAADSAVECVLFWDIKHPGLAESAFSTSTCPQDISCAGLNLVVGGPGILPPNPPNPPDPDFFNPGFSAFSLGFGDGSCATTTVVKIYRDPPPASGPTIDTMVKSYGRNVGDALNCESSAANRVERAFEVTY